MIVKFLAFSCPHVPLQDREAVDFMLRELEAFNPDYVIHMGDGHESDAASRWPSENKWDLLAEFEQHNSFLASIREVSPDSKKVFCNGNHDDNILSEHRIPEKLRSICDFRKHEPELAYWKQLPYVYSSKGVFRIGQVSFFHGYESGVSSDEFQSYLLGLPFGLTVSGHTHRPVSVTRAMRTKAVPLPYWYANVGCLAEMDFEYMKRKRQVMWGQAICKGEVCVQERPRRSYYYSRNWDAEISIHQMHSV